jgi:hypothetical protein
LSWTSTGASATRCNFIRIAAALEHAGSLEARSRELIGVKLVHFAPNRGVLRALLRNGADASTCFRPSVRKQRRPVTSTSLGLAAFFLIAACRFHTTSNRTCRPCFGSSRWA